MHLSGRCGNDNRNRHRIIKLVVMRDFLQLENGDLDLTTGDIVTTDATRQHQRDIILTRAGSMKHAPARGVGIEDFFNDDTAEGMLRRVRQEMVKDGMRVTEIREAAGDIQVKAYYEADYNG